ncbi:relaxase/mobilization nuclease domain-containing protein [Prevotella sp. AGR2160]|uniref:relaxase/mobilization nuclease domain-containing protein n=1 Tax=Prevotella sp. AGR2160 TaxID=1280674 RepID=UPI00041675E1|nr:relaxase/mobilization nuclease domain-containing protein [Prevotella sp. AGR2160]
MIIKKLQSVHGGVFPGAAYNEKKVLEGVAELAGYANIDGNFLHTLRTLHGVGIDGSKEVERYLQGRSETYGNTRSTQWQLHLALSCKGQEKNKEQLVSIAHAMMREYGMGCQPYFIYFHHDTENNHVHILTTRITEKGRLMSDHHDYRRLNAALNRVVCEDQQNDIRRMFGYSFTTEGQLMNIAREFNYKVGESKEGNGILSFYHGGAETIRVRRSDIEARIAEVKTDKRDIARREETAKRLKAIIIKYRELSLKQAPYSDDDQKMKSEGKEEEHAKTKKELMKRKKVKILPEVKKLTDAKGKPLSKLEQYQMQWFIDELRNKFGIAVHFQKDKNGVVRGYGIVDHNNKVALNGSEVMKLADIIGITEWKAAQESKAIRKTTKRVDKTSSVSKAKPSDNVKLPAWSNKGVEQSDIPKWADLWNNRDLHSGANDSDSDRVKKTSASDTGTSQNRTATRPSFDNRSQAPASKENETPKETVKATIYSSDSTLDIYRPMFRARACSVNGKNIVRMELDGKTYDHTITDNQTEWYCKAPAEAHDDIAIRLAVFYFYKEIYESYRRQLAEAYVKVGGNALELPEGDVRCYKLMNGLWRVAFDSNGSTIHYDLTDQESRMMNRLDGNKAAFNETKVRLFKEHVARDEANAIVRNLRYDDIGVYPSYASKDDAPDKIASFISQHQQLMQRLMSVLTHYTGNGFNREFEVGGKRGRWDDIDDERRFKGGMSM